MNADISIRIWRGNSMNRFITPFGSGEREYSFNRVKYLVSAGYETVNPADTSENRTLDKRIKRIIGSDFTDLTNTVKDTTLEDNKADMTAEKEV